MHDKIKQPQLAASVQALLAGLRRKIRRYVWFEGLGAAAVWLGVAFWASLILDWFFEPSPRIRIALLAAASVVLAAIVVQQIVRRLVVPLGDSSMALLLERYYPRFNESLITAVELTDPRATRSDFNADMLDRTCHVAAESAGDVRLKTVFNPLPMRRNLLVAAILGLSIAGFAVNSPRAFGVWVNRNLLFSSELWPRNTRLVVEGFHDGAIKVARGSDLSVIAKADLRKPLVPSVVEVRYRTDGGGRMKQRMVREGTADPRRDRFQEYSYTFGGILSPIRFDVIGGDDAVRDLRIQVVDSPTVTKMTLEYRYPAYTGRAPQTLPVTGLMQVPAGSEITLRARANKELDRILVASGFEESGKPPQVIRPAAGSDRREFHYRVPKFSADTTLLFTLLDHDGIQSREPVRVALALLADEPPQVNVHLRGIGSAITSQARLPAEGQILDDYGIAKVWFDYTINQKTHGTGVTRSLAGNATDLEVDQALEVRDLNLAPGQKLLASLKAADRCDLSGEANVGSSDHWLLDVVTPEQLRTMLEARELVLRQRFETILRDVTETRDLLARMEFAAGAPAASEKAAADELEPEEKPDKPEPLSPERLVALRTLRLERALQNSQKDAAETLGVAEAFSDIREELINNRIDTEELKIRLETGIAEPLRRVAQVMFPELDRRLDRLQAAIADEARASESLAQATQQLDRILAEMRRALDRMVELQDFNEAVELLREIVESQEKLHEQTRERQKQKLRDLLE